MQTRRMKKLKEAEELSTTTTRMENPSDQNQLSEEEKNAIAREKKAMQRVFEIPLVVEEILDYLKFRELMSCRRVCSMWKETATKIILKRDCSQVILDYDIQMRKFGRRLNYGSIVKQYHVTEFTQIMENSNPFPSSTLIINEGKLGDSEVLDFFKAGGNGIKTLKLNWVNGTSLENLYHILVHCPNVETLRIQGTTIRRKENIKIELPKLKVLSMSTHFQDTGHYEILQTLVAPNLQVIKNFNLRHDTTDVVKAGKVHTVKELHLLDSDEYTPLDLFQEFVSAGPRIEVLKFWFTHNYTDNTWQINFAGPLQQLLDTCKDTLKILEFNGLGLLFENLRFPKFSQLNEMKIGDYSGRGPVRLFPIRINLAETFPNLKIFNVGMAKLEEDANWDKYFPSPDAYRGQLTSVTRVKIRKGCAQRCKEMLRLMCPNATIQQVSKFSW